MNAMTLYDVTLEGMQIEDLLSANDGELTPELEERFDKLLREGPQRIEAAAMVVRGMEATEAACKAEAQRLNERALMMATQAKKLKQRMVIATDAAFGGKVKTSLFTIWIQKAADSISIALEPEYNIDQFRESFPEFVKTEYYVDNAAVRQLLKANETSLKAAADLLTNPDCTDEEREWARVTLGIIPDALDIQFKTGDRYLRIK